MSNMSYCRFQNTLADLEDCNNSLLDTEDDTQKLSDEEKRAAQRLILLCKEIASRFYFEE